ncbi:pyridoxal phosphate-dependent aminotransferase [Albimonas pacifica]|uniref:histidinol-phosphate transaminase n=1 Tax=Albimonas pacifica TaxID=1114924 RepID=A0A1I3D8X9_9RHOB|nr:pyridoxal phosphate-dependent aminotransferase [Albimonas pacifica]SFH83059.1 histidinol-phosphate aminotransferase [Albimonas pacifica]
MSRPHFTPLVERLPATIPFVSPEQQQRALGRPFSARLGANENVFGPSPRALAAMAQALPECWMYADAEHRELREALAAKHGVPFENIIVGEGVDGLLGLLARVLVSEGTPVVTSNGAYPTFNYHVASFGGRLVKVPYRDDHEDPDALLAAAAREAAPLVYIANPDNPMGTWWPASKMQAMIAAMPSDSVLCLDEAYIEFAPEGTAPEIDPEDPRVVRMRTFSKAYGMAGMRVGYAIATKRMIAAFNKVKNHFGMNRIGLVGAAASLADADWIPQIRARVEAARGRIGEIAEKNGLSALPSATNFVAVDCGRDGDFAKAVLSALIERGVFVRMPFVEPENRCIRVSAGTPEMLDAFETALPQALAEAAAALESAEA